MSLIWLNMPGKRVWPFLSPILGTILDRIINLLIFKDTIGDFQRVSLTLLIIILSLTAYLIIGTIISLLRTIKSVNREDALEESLLTIADRIEVGELGTDAARAKIFIRRRWLPSSNMPNSEELINSIDIGSLFCPKCSADLAWNYDNDDISPAIYYQCSDFGCSNKTKYYENQLDDLKEKIRAKFSGKIRSNPTDYWQKYVESYNEITGNHPERYKSPLE